MLGVMGNGGHGLPVISAWAFSQRSGVMRNMITPCGATLPP
jgi:hypothetical protein